MLSKMGVKDAFRQVAAEWDGCTKFGYVFGDFVAVDRRLVFGWRNSPGFYCLLVGAIDHAHSSTSFDDAVVTPQGLAATRHVRMDIPAAGEAPVQLPPECKVPSGQGGGATGTFWVRSYVDDTIGVEPLVCARGSRCLRASASLASDHFRLFGPPLPTDPPLLAPAKVSSWSTSLDVLGWTVDTSAMVISLTSAKLLQLSLLLEAWPPARAVASEYELRSLMGKLLHVSEVVRRGFVFVRRIIQRGVSPVRPWDERFGVSGRGKGRRKLRACVRLGPEFHDDISFWRMVMQRALGPEGGSRLSAPLLSLYCNRMFARCGAMRAEMRWGGYCLESGCWWRYDFDENVRARVRPKVFGRDDLSINFLELLAMTVTAWAFTVQAATPPDYPGASILMRGNNSSGVYWVNRCRGSREPRSDAVMRMIGCLEMRSGWCFRAKHVKGVANTLADGISRWERDSISAKLTAFRPDVNWQEQILGEAGTGLITDVVASSASADQLRPRLGERTSRVADLGTSFAG